MSLTGPSNQPVTVYTPAKGSTAAGDVTSTAVDANTQALDTNVKAAFFSNAYKAATQTLGVSVSANAADASIDVVLTGQPAAGDTLTLFLDPSSAIGAYTFIAGASSGFNVQVGATSAITASNLATAFGAHSLTATFPVSPTTIHTSLTNVHGSGGNAYYFTTTSAVISFANAGASNHFTGGQDALATQATLQQVANSLILGQDTTGGSLSLPVITPFGFVQKVSGSVNLTGTLPAGTNALGSVLISGAALPVNAAQELGGVNSSTLDMLTQILAELRLTRLMMASAFGLDPTAPPTDPNDLKT